MARGLQELINIEDPEDRYGEALEVIVKLQDDVESSLRRLLAFRDSWYTQENLVNRLEKWMSTAERELASVQDQPDGHMRQFWVSTEFFRTRPRAAASKRFRYELIECSN